MPTVTSGDGTSIAFETAGTGPPLIMVDPAGSFRGFGPMGPIAERLASDFTVITYDRRGRGESADTLPYAVDREVEDIGALIDAAGGSALAYGFSSGAVLLLLAAAAGVPIAKLALLEPPFELDEEAQADTALEARIAELVAAGRRGDAYEEFNRSIGVPEEYLVGMREAPWWSKIESLAHTLVYDLIVGRTLAPARLPDIRTPTLVIDSEGSDERLHTWAVGVAEALPNGRHTTLKGEWHGVAPEILAPVLVEFFTDRSGSVEHG